MFLFLSTISPLKWRIISVVLLVTAFAGSAWYYGEVQYKEGHVDGSSSADKEWTLKYNEIVDKSNAKIKKIENESKLEAADLRSRVTGLSLELDTLKKQRDTTSVNSATNRDGSLFVCPKTPLKLGTTLSTTPELRLSTQLLVARDTTDTVDVPEDVRPPLMLYLSDTFSAEWDEINVTVNAKLTTSLEAGAVQP